MHRENKKKLRKIEKDDAHVLFSKKKSTTYAHFEQTMLNTKST